MFFTTVVQNSKRMLISEVLRLKPLNKPLQIQGWVKKNRKLKKNAFLHVDDGSCLQRLQIFAKSSDLPKNIGFQSCVSINGVLVESSGPKQDIELLADSIEVLSDPSPIEYPFVEKGDYLVEDLRMVPHFRARIRDFASILRVRAATKRSIHKYFERQNFLQIDTPVLTSNNCEGAGEIFRIKGNGSLKAHDNVTEHGDGIFCHPVYLSVSAQLHLEAAASGMSKVYTLNPAFRGEKGSRFHLHEFWMLEAEEAFLIGDDGYQSLCQRMEDLIKFVVKDVLESRSDDLSYLWDHHQRNEQKDILQNVIEKSFVRMSFKEAEEIIERNSSKMVTPSPPGHNFNKESEHFLTHYCGSIPVMITDYPSHLKPFYMMPKKDNAEEVYGIDLLVPDIGELCGGGLREYRMENLKHKVEALKMKEQLQWYLDIRSWGHPPTGGFGLGFERLLQFITGISNIKDVIAFPRSNGRCDS